MLSNILKEHPKSKKCYVLIHMTRYKMNLVEVFITTKEDIMTRTMMYMGNRSLISFKGEIQTLKCSDTNSFMFIH